jgi:dihydroflavonol-4-reductase
MNLVTGATGLVGSHLIFDLVTKGEQVRALKRKTSDLMHVQKLFSSQPELFKKIEWVEGDVTDIFSLEEVMKGISKVYHCAAIVSYDPAEAESMFKINVEGTANVVNLCLENKVEKLCHVSSVAAINRLEEDEMITENAEWKNSKHHSNYALSKYGAEREVWRGIAEGLNAVIVNPTIIIGRGNWKTGSTAMFGQVWKGLKFYTNGVSGFVDVHDVTRIMIQLMESSIKAERFIISSENVPFRLVLDMISKKLGKPLPSIYANNFLRGIAWRVEALKKLLFKTRPFITRETAHSGSIKVRFSNEKIKKMLHVDFIPVQKAIETTSEAFLKEFKRN